MKKIRESLLAMNDRAKRREPPSLKMEIVLTTHNDEVKVIIIQDYITQALPRIAGGGPSHYYTLDVVSGRRQKRKQTRKSSKPKLKRKTSKSNLKRKKA